MSLIKFSTKLIVVTLLSLLLAACGPGASSNANVASTPVATTEPESVSPTLEVTTAAVPPIDDTPTTPQQEGGLPVTNNKINLNEMTEDDLLNSIPGFSGRMVREFFEYQPYVSIQQFRREIGKYVDDAQVAAYEEYVYVPVNVDESDAETLQQIPGIDDTIAAELIAARPFGSNEAFLAKLAEYLSAEQTAVAASYLTIP